MLVCVFFAILHARRPVQRAPGIPCALYSQSGETIFANLGQIMPRDRGVMTSLREATLTVIASQRVAPNARPMTGSAEQSIGQRRKNGLLRRFAPRNDGLYADAARRDSSRRATPTAVIVRESGRSSIPE